MERYPLDLVVTVQDFADCNWQNILGETAEAGYEPLWRAFSKAAELAMKAKTSAPSKAFWLLADVCAMRLLSSSDNQQEPFVPTITHLGWQTARLDDFTESDLVFFAQVVEATDNPWLKARLADLLWVRKYKDKHHMALTALDNYLQVPVSTDILQKDWQDCWERAITLANMLGKAADEKLAAIKSRLLDTLHAVTKLNGWLACRVSALLLRIVDKDQAVTVAKELVSLAHEYDTDTEQAQVMIAGRLFSDAARYFDIANDKAEAAVMKAQVARCYVREGMSRIQTPHPSHVAAASFYEQAIQMYRTIPRTNRQALGVEERITDLRRAMEEASEKSLSELDETPLPEMDFREQKAWASQAVQGKTLDDALQAFAGIIRSPFKYQDLRQQVVERLKQPSLINIFPVTIFADNGRVIARVPPMNTDVDLTGEPNSTRIFWEMTKTYREWLNFYVNAFILPALDSLVVEYRLREADLIELASRSPIVPIGRERLFGKALFAGFNHDFVTALHLLAPQVEHMVRHHLKHAGASTTCLDKSGVQTENGLSTIIGLPEAKKVFGEDLVFEIEALYCTAMGPNLRNRLAHGLLDDNDCRSIEAIYAWWLGLRLVYHSFWNTVRIG